ncbi:FeoA domain-containing protein [Staphylococcus warneri]|uniref:Ferrous iron transporter A n=3 Tax=Staphylococcus TaxID=1279 RepID=A0A2V3ZN52_STAWA|nr:MULTISPECIES: FeoA domain-containing protein [Staphylococcus]MBJ7884191.1 FeoA domain-containing protein [Bacillaceae bacterium HSR45]MCC8989356.1 FeoA domain-containing protein [Staphylococcus sp.]QAV30518.1 ferrous iron transporter A [Sulfitobacter donghicola]CRG02707.1 FeoA domain [Streptococcus pneumoniae]SKR69166.1 FeoA domain [Mycobacteroides abscessus subsp. abscessus]
MLNIKSALKNKKYKIKQIDINNKDMIYRLNAFGIRVGSDIKVKQRCMFNGPCVIEISGQQVSIRHCDACQIALEE